MEIVEDAVIRASVYRERFNKARATQIGNLIQDLEVKVSGDLYARIERLSDKDVTRFTREDYSTTRLRALLTAIQELSVEWRKIVERGIEVGGKELIESEILLNEKIIGITGALGEGISPVAVYVAAKARPMETTLIRNAFKAMETNVKAKVVKTLKLGFLAGDTNDQIVRSLIGTKSKGYEDGVLDVHRRGAESLVRTAMNHLSSQTALESYKALGLSEGIWTSTLDSRTTDICFNRDGRVIDLTSSRPLLPPAHMSCRSFIRPKLPGDELEFRASKGSEGGKTVKNQSYPVWFEKQSAAFQRETLGATKYRLYKAGLPLSKFTDRAATRTYTISELRLNHSELFSELGI